MDGLCPLCLKDATESDLRRVMICSFADCQAATLAGGKPIAGGGAEVCYHDDCVHHYLRGTQKVMCARFGRVPTGALTGYPCPAPLASGNPCPGSIIASHHKQPQNMKKKMKRIEAAAMVAAMPRPKPPPPVPKPKETKSTAAPPAKTPAQSAMMMAVTRLVPKLQPPPAPDPAAAAAALRQQQRATIPGMSTPLKLADQRAIAAQLRAEALNQNKNKERDKERAAAAAKQQQQALKAAPSKKLLAGQQHDDGGDEDENGVRLIPPKPTLGNVMRLAPGLRGSNTFAFDLHTLVPGGSGRKSGSAQEQPRPEDFPAFGNGAAVTTNATAAPPLRPLDGATAGNGPPERLAHTFGAPPPAVRAPDPGGNAGSELLLVASQEEEEERQLQQALQLSLLEAQAEAAAEAHYYAQAGEGGDHQAHYPEDGVDAGAPAPAAPGGGAGPDAFDPALLVHAMLEALPWSEHMEHFYMPHLNAVYCFAPGVAAALDVDDPEGMARAAVYSCRAPAQQQHGAGGGGGGELLLLPELFVHDLEYHKSASEAYDAAIAATEGADAPPEGAAVAVAAGGAAAPAQKYPQQHEQQQEAAACASAYMYHVAAPAGQLLPQQYEQQYKQQQQQLASPIAAGADAVTNPSLFYGGAAVYGQQHRDVFSYDNNVGTQQQHQQLPEQQWHYLPQAHQAQAQASLALVQAAQHYNGGVYDQQTSDAMQQQQQLRFQQLQQQSEKKLQQMQQHQYQQQLQQQLQALKQQQLELEAQLLQQQLEQQQQQGQEAVGGEEEDLEQLLALCMVGSGSPPERVTPAPSPFLPSQWQQHEQLQQQQQRLPVAFGTPLKGMPTATSSVPMAVAAAGAGHDSLAADYGYWAGPAGGNHAAVPAGAWGAYA